MQIGMYELLCKAQEMIARKYPTILTDKSKRGEIKNYIAQFLYDTGYTVEGYSMKQVTDRLFSEMAEYSFLTAYLNDRNIEEININGWDDVALTYLDGHIEKSDEQFFSPGHAVDKTVHFRCSCMRFGSRNLFRLPFFYGYRNLILGMYARSRTLCGSRLHQV